MDKDETEKQEEEVKKLLEQTQKETEALKRLLDILEKNSKKKEESGPDI